MEGFDTCASDRSVSSLHTNQMDFVVDLDFALLDSTCDDTSTSSDVQRSVNTHKEVLVLLASRLYDYCVHCVDQLFHRLLTQHGVRSMQCR